MKHTKGPWTVELDAVYDGGIDILAGDIPVASVEAREIPEATGHVPRETGIANARLIAAAPDLYEAVQTALLTLNINRRYIECKPLEDKLRAAIAKAEGKTNA